MSMVHQRVRGIERLVQEIECQDQIHPSGYPATRDGIRLAIAVAQEDELGEALEAWRRGRCKCPTPMCGHHDWTEAAEEMVQAAAVIMRSVIAIEAAQK
jgi:hypothetical protein